MTNKTDLDREIDMQEAYSVMLARENHPYKKRLQGEIIETDERVRGEERDLSNKRIIKNRRSEFRRQS